MKYTSEPILFKSIKEMPKEQRPREKMESCGLECLSDLELVCLLLGRGNRYRPIHETAQDVLKCLEETPWEDLGKELGNINGLGKAQAGVICAALEAGRRFSKAKGVLLNTPEGIYRLISHYGDRKQEHLLCIALSGAMELIECRIITIGLVNRTLVHPREVFAYAIEKRATSIIVAHNHPSGNLLPSADDLDVTSVLKKPATL